ncbi:MAG: MFS transporter [Peptococcaceae bacterium]|jgi:MFS family permease|nr:MFS transporter [Peptococcaceae bacterium]
MKEIGQQERVSERIWTRDFTLSTVSGLFAAMIMYMTMTTFAVYAQTAFGTTKSLAGLAASIFVIGSVLGRIASGQCAGRVSERTLLIISGALLFGISFTYMIPAGFGVLLSLRIIHGLSFGLFHTTLSTVVIQFIPRQRFAEGIGFFSLNFVIATAAGPFLGMLLVRLLSYTALFWACILCGALAFLLVLSVRIRPLAPQGGAAPDGAKHSWGIVEPAALPLSFVIILMSGCYTGVTAFLESYTGSLGLGNAAPLFFVVYAVFILVFRPLAGKLLDRRGDNIVMIPTILFYAASLLVLAFTHSVLVIFLSAFLMALGYGNVLNMGQAVAVKSVPLARIGKATSTYFMFSDAGMGLGPVLLGLVAGGYGFTAMYSVEVVVVLIGLAIYYALHGRKCGSAP